VTVLCLAHVLVTPVTVLCLAPRFSHPCVCSMSRPTFWSPPVTVLCLAPRFVATRNRTLARLTYLYNFPATYNSYVLMPFFPAANCNVSLPRDFLRLISGDNYILLFIYHTLEHGRGSLQGE
jgi:hypothetical protein